MDDIPMIPGAGCCPLPDGWLEPAPAAPSPQVLPAIGSAEGGPVRDNDNDNQPAMVRRGRGGPEASR